MERTVVVSRTLLIVIAIFLALVGAAVAWPRLLTTGAAGVEPDPGQVAVKFVSKFYAVDYRDRQGWLDALAPLATAEGIALLEQNIAVLLWPQLAAGQTVVSAGQVSADDAGLSVEGTSQVDGGSAWQVRSVAVTLADGVAWPAMARNTFTAYVMLRQEAGQWKFATFMSEAQVNALRQSASANP
jgi:hypothetical protein